MQAVFVGFGIEYLAMAVNAARTLRATSPGVDAVVVTNVPAEMSFLESEFDSVIFLDQPNSANRQVKLRADEFVTSDVAVSLDADVEILGDIRPIFSLLEQYDVLLHAFRVPTKFQFPMTSDLMGSMVAQFWGGVIFFRRNERSRALFATWSKRFAESGVRRDQPALQRAVLDLPDLRLMPLNMVWGSSHDEIRRHADLPRESARIVANGLHVDSPERQRLLAAHEAVIAALPPSHLLTDEVLASILSYKRIRQLIMLPRPLRPLAELVWRAQDRQTGVSAPPRWKQDAAAGRAHLGGVPLWDDIDSGRAP